MEAYSQPITPPPMTIMLLGMTSVERIESESQIVTSLKGISSGRRGRDPVAMTMNGAVSKSLSLLLADTFRMCWSTNEAVPWMISTSFRASRSEEHTSELQSQSNLVCRLLLEKKKT